MEGSLRELAGYRMERAKEMLSASAGNFTIGEYKMSLNRSYYAIFHAMCAANILKGFDSSKKSDYDDFFIASKGDAERQLANARVFVNAVKIYLDTVKDTKSK